MQQWSRRTHDDIVKQLNDVREHMAVPDVDVVVGSGHDWQAAVDSVPWDTGDMLVLGSGAAGPGGAGVPRLGRGRRSCGTHRCR